MAYNYIDMHCDTLMHALMTGKEDVVSFDGRSIDVDRLYEAKAGAQCFAMFIPQRGDTPDDHWEIMEKMRKIFCNTLEKASDKIAFAGCTSDLEKNKKEGKVSAILTIENSYLVDGSLERLKKLKELGVSIMSLTWNSPNCFGACNSRDPEENAKGLTEFGREAVAYMNDLGIIVDVSHFSDGGFWDVARYTKKPFVATHSNARAVSPHQRNLTDDMIRALADAGGITGLNFCGNFLNEDIEDDNSTVEAMVRNVEHIVNVGGIDCMAVGTDFDGIGGTLEVADVLQMHKLFDALEKKGYSGKEIEKISHLNFMRVFKDTVG